jgi:hypothetical protein
MIRPYQEETPLPWWYSALTNKDLRESRSRVAPALPLALFTECLEGVRLLKKSLSDWSVVQNRSQTPRNQG